MKKRIVAAAAIMASSAIVSDGPCMSRARSRKAGASIGNTQYGPKTSSSEASNSSVLVTLPSACGEKPVNGYAEVVGKSW